MNEPPDLPPSPLPDPMMISSTLMRHPPALVNPGSSPQSGFLSVRIVLIRCLALPPVVDACSVDLPCLFQQGMGLVILPTPFWPPWLPQSNACSDCDDFGCCPFHDAGSQFLSSQQRWPIWFFSTVSATVFLICSVFPATSSACPDRDDFGCCTFQDSGSQSFSSQPRRQLRFFFTVYATGFLICSVCPATVCLLHPTHELLSECAVFCLSSREVCWLWVVSIDVNF